MLEESSLNLDQLDFNYGKERENMKSLLSLIMNDNGSDSNWNCCLTLS